MSTNYQQDVYEQLRSFSERQGWEYKESIESNTLRLDISHGRSKCIAKVFYTGTIQIQGAESRLKEVMEEAKQTIEQNGLILKELLPFEIEAFPDTLKQNIPDVDPIIIRFLSEAITCLKANSLLGCSFLLGAASEKAIWLLIETYTAAIINETNRNKFRERVSGKFISRAFEEFKQSFRSCKSKPSDEALMQDLDTKVESIFQFCRICRNEVGHPQITPNLDRGVLIANMGQFVKYIESIYSLIDYFNNNSIEV